MVDIRLQEDEAEILQQVLTDYVSDLRMEVNKTENLEWREALKDREAFLKRLIPQLRQGSATIVTPGSFGG